MKRVAIITGALVFAAVPCFAGFNSGLNFGYGEGFSRPRIVASGACSQQLDYSQSCNSQYVMLNFQ